MGLEDQLCGRRQTPSNPAGPTTCHGRALTKAAASRIVGGLSQTTKMPCHSWGIPARHCKTGSKLAPVEGSVCHDCYARKFAYLWPRVQEAYDRRLSRAAHPDWGSAMATLVRWQATYNDQPYFRWFDSGDLQSLDMLERIAEVAERTPEIRHWLPTREHRLVFDYLKTGQPPENLTLRLSAYFVDDEPPDILGLPTSTVHRFESPIGYRCPAYDRKPTTCRDCRACWDSGVTNVSYEHH